MAKKLNLDDARARQAEYTPEVVAERCPETYPEIYLRTAQRICDAEKQEDFTTREIYKTAGALGPGKMFVELFYDPGMTTFEGWHDEIDNLDHVECRVIALCLLAAISGG